MLFRTPITTVIPLIQASTRNAASLLNVTVDDSAPDPWTGSQIVYSDDWNVGQDCSGCTARLDPTKTYGGTWHDAAHNEVSWPFKPPQTATFNFTGSALYVYGILGSSATYTSDLLFSIDGQLHGNLTLPANGSVGFKYNVSLFAIDALPHGPHTFTVQNGRQGGQASLILLDYLVYTTQNDAIGETTTSIMPIFTPQSTPPIPTDTTSLALSESLHKVDQIGLAMSIAFGSLIGIVGVIVGTWYIRRRRLRQRTAAGDAPMELQLRTENMNWRSDVAEEKGYRSYHPEESYARGLESH